MTYHFFIRIFVYASLFFVGIFLLISDLNKCVIGHELLSNKNTYSVECIKALPSLKIIGVVILIIITSILIKLVHKRLKK